MIRDNLPRGTPDRLLKEITAKSIRHGTITTMMARGDLAPHHAAYRSGHAGTKTSLDSYTDITNVVLSLPGGNALARWSDLMRTVHLPSIHLFGNDTAVIALIKQMFLISLPEFKEGGLLWAATKSFGSSLIMYHNLVTSSNGLSDAVATKLRDSAHAINLKDSRWPDSAPETVLANFSDIGLKRFRENNQELAIAKPDITSLANVVNQQGGQLVNMCGKIEELMTEVRDSNSVNKRVMQENSHLHMRVRDLEQQKNSIERKLASVKMSLNTTPPRYAVPAAAMRPRDGSLVLKDNTPNKSPRSSASSSPSQNTTLQVSSTARDPQDTDTLAGSQRMSAILPASTENNQSSVGTRLVFGNKAKASEKGSTRNKTLASLLELYNEKGIFKGGKWHEIPVPNNCGFTELWAVKNSMELCELVATEDEKSLLESDMDRADLKVLANSIQERAFLHMWTLEGVKDVEEENRLEKLKSTNHQKKPFYHPIGNRVKKQKKKVLERTGIEQLIICPPEQPAANSLSRFGFGRRKKKTSNSNESSV